MAIDRDGRYGIGGFLVGAGFNAAYQFGANYYTNGKNFWRALKCVDVLDVLISGGLGAVGLGVGGNLLKGNLRGAGLGGGLGVYLKVFMTPYPAKFGDKCECKKDPFFEPLNGLVQ